MPDAALRAFGPQTKIRDIVAKLGNTGSELLKRHGYELGEGFVDILSQYQTLEHAARSERLRDLATLLRELNSAT